MPRKNIAKMINFNKPYLTGKEMEYMKESVLSLKISGDGVFTQKCHNFFEQKYGFKKCLLTTSCTDALEMAAILIDIKPGDEVIVPSFTFVSTANAFVLRGAKIIFADSLPNHPNIDVSKIESLISPKTKAIVPVHYAGNACDMNHIMHLAEKYGLYVIEDAAQAIDSHYNGKPLGTFGHFAAFSFHETKNIISGEGGMLVINDDKFIERAEIIREKGTNRSKFFRGEVDKYGWVDVGSSFLPSDLIAAFLYAQLENLEEIQRKRKLIWNWYYEELKALIEDKKIKTVIPSNEATQNGHMFPVLLPNAETRTVLIDFLKSKQIFAVFHYISLHKSSYFIQKHDNRNLVNSDVFSDCLLRLPFYYELSHEEVKLICKSIFEFFNEYQI
jgi:dTDP-4-amino-4,6-dideoxygalactose transaminase